MKTEKWRSEQESQKEYIGVEDRRVDIKWKNQIKR
jgi:hypothetical protein